MKGGILSPSANCHFPKHWIPLHSIHPGEAPFKLGIVLFEERKYTYKAWIRPRNSVMLNLF